MGSSDILTGWLGKDGVFGYTCWLVGDICCPYWGRVRSGLHTFSRGGQEGEGQAAGVGRSLGHCNSHSETGGMVRVWQFLFQSEAF